MTVLLTGAAGFIGSAVCKKLLALDYRVIGIDNLNDAYEVQLKKDRLSELQQYSKAAKKDFTFHLQDITIKSELFKLFEHAMPTAVINLAAQAGVRRSLEYPVAFIESNICGFINILEACRHYNVEHLVYASSSSVYGANTEMPFSEHSPADHPLSLYAATKRANELMAHSYSHLFNLPTTGLRFFTVYGPWGRPDMALFLFANAIVKGEPIDVYNEGNHQRDFTYIDDIVEGIVRVLARPPQGNASWNGNKPDPASSAAPWRVYNIGNNNPVSLLRYIEELERCLRLSARKNFMPLQAGDVPATYADIADLVADFDYSPKVSIGEGIEKFVAWYKRYYGIE